MSDDIGLEGLGGELAVLDVLQALLPLGCEGWVTELLFDLGDEGDAFARR